MLEERGKEEEKSLLRSFFSNFEEGERQVFVASWLVVAVDALPEPAQERVM